ncbi:AarF/ABC1/UbiB kinase family protein [Halogeometricum borinquense]|uniref:AarF/ABC1/UbiB kinase family protein n=1 Tax=Halogeometricum borinquense TaxID=60847 RepID=A0A6C0UIQ5_9EURY|nr:AarF/ABC1/UbiB kinase family protein [Halogeometricum borinquense]QIB75097.1 AarF/ABC1/UbiB kinase family protein [Halogeometricum borinquense]QIQ75922.1 AarF/ABC1/UbiB kinase family protein [Halogeometricum borinquense]
MSAPDSERSAEAAEHADASGSTDGSGPVDVPEPDAERPSGLRVTLRSLWRLLVVIRTFLPLFVGIARDRRRFLLFGRRRRPDSTTRRQRATYLRDSLISLGPTFIKLGQILSTRPDALPGEYVEVLSSLQDKVPPDDWETVRPRIEEELGPVEETFDHFDREPISGASLGQVYTAVADGEEVAVKVLRPDIRRVVAADLRVVETLMPVLLWFAHPGQRFTFENLADEFADTIHEEMDYAHEAAMLREIRSNFSDNPKIRVPVPREAYSTKNVLTMEYVEGVKIDRVREIERLGIDREELARRLERAYIQMILEDGAFHADPHPGNLAVQSDGTLIFYDFGMTGRIGPATRDHMYDFYVGVARDDIDRVIDAFIAMEALDPTANRELMRETFTVAIETLRGQDVDQYRIQQLVSQFEETLYDFPLRLPQDLALVVRVSTVLEGVCRTLVPEFDFVDEVTEYVRERGIEGEAGDSSVQERFVREYAADAAAQVRETARTILSVPPKLNSVLGLVEREDVRVNVVLEDSDAVTAFGKKIVSGILLSSNLLAVALLYALENQLTAGVVALGVPPLAFLLYRAFRGERGVRVRGDPQFTRQGLRARRGEDSGAEQSD